MLKEIGKYEILDQLGTGSMGTVYKARDRNIGRTVAIKTIKLPESDREKAEMAKRFKQEARAAGNLSHPNIVIIFEYDEVGDTAFIVMEYVSGVELKTCFDNQEAFSQDRIVSIMQQLLSALDYSHRHGVIHRDIKPSNVMLTADGQVRVTDFGIARLESSELTQVGVALGTPSYMSPEQCMGQPVDGRSDIFSAGVLLYQLLTGEKPFAGPSITSILHKITQLEPPAPSQLNYTVSPIFDTIVSKALAKRPADRFSSAADFAAALNQIGSDPAPPDSRPQPEGEEATMAIPLDGSAAFQALAAAPDTTVAVPLGNSPQQPEAEEATVAVPISEAHPAGSLDDNDEATTVIPVAEEATVAVPLSEVSGGAPNGSSTRRLRPYAFGSGIILVLIVGALVGWQLLGDRGQTPAPPVAAPPAETIEAPGSTAAEPVPEPGSPPHSTPAMSIPEESGPTISSTPETTPPSPAIAPPLLQNAAESPPAAAPAPGSATLEEPPQPAPAERVEPPVSAGGVVIATDPPGAAVYHQTLGALGTANPLQTSLDPGLHQLYITKPGFQELSILLEIPENGAQQLRLTLQHEP